MEILSEILLQIKWERYINIKNGKSSFFPPPPFFFSRGRIRINASCNYGRTHVRQKLGNIFNYISSNRWCCRATCVIRCRHRDTNRSFQRSPMIFFALRLYRRCISWPAGWKGGIIFSLDTITAPPIMVVLPFDTLPEIIGL